MGVSGSKWQQYCGDAAGRSEGSKGRESTEAEALRLHDQWKIRPRRMPTPEQAKLPAEEEAEANPEPLQVSAVHAMLANVELEMQAERHGA